MTIYLHPKNNAGFQEKISKLKKELGEKICQMKNL